MNSIPRFAVPAVAIFMASIYLITSMVPPDPPDDRMQLYEYGKNPVQDGGRVKPLDSLARNSLMVISGKQEFTDKDGHTQPAIKWLLDVMTSRLPGAKATPDKYPVFRIENDQLLSLLGLERRSGLRYALSELQDKADKFDKRVEYVRSVDKKDRDLYDLKVFELSEHLQLYDKLSHLEVAMVPAPGSKQEWQTLWDALGEEKRTGKENPSARLLAQMLGDYADGNVREFNRHLAAYREQVDTQVPGAAAGKAGFESFFNHATPFYHCGVLYVLMFLLTCLGWVAYLALPGWSGPLNQGAFWLGVVVLTVHTLALVSRMYLMDRPLVFVTNLYSSAVFIGWGAVGMGLVLELLYRNGLGNAVAAVLGASTMVVAHHLATTSSDTLEMMQAVLDTNFWLATHVTCVSMGYMSTFVAGFLGIVFVLLSLFTPLLPRELFKVLGQMIYGIICFAMLFSFVGTVLGGIWADQSWGRFWGWDPKENGALLIVIMNALILHARWGGVVKLRGMALLAICGNMVTGWSWFGTNQLSIGLHAYGFNKELADGLKWFWFSQLFFLGLGLVPTRLRDAFWNKVAPPQALPAGGPRRPGPRGPR